MLLSCGSSPANDQFGSVRDDFDGDGYTDVAMLYDADGSNNTVLYVMRGTGSDLAWHGQVSCSGRLWFHQELGRAKLAAGDLTGTRTLSRPALVNHSTSMYHC